MGPQQAAPAPPTETTAIAIAVQAGVTESPMEGAAVAVVEEIASPAPAEDEDPFG